VIPVAYPELLPFIGKVLCQGYGGSKQKNKKKTDISHATHSSNKGTEYK
jgi:hypothetical protein